MIKTSKQLTDLIRNKALGDSRKSQQYLRIYMMERLLERVSLSDYRNFFILKGGMLVASLVGVEFRSTMDIDTTITSFSLSQETATNILTEIMNIPLEDNILFRLIKTEPIMQDHRYEGLRFHLEGSLGKLRQAIKIDISTGDTITPRAIQYEYTLLLEKRTIHLLTYNIETLLAEKLETVLARAEQNTRMRDFYDIHVLFQSERANINQVDMRNAFSATCQSRNTTTAVLHCNEILDALLQDAGMQNNWNRYRFDNPYVGSISWNEVCRSVCELLDYTL